MSGVFEETEDRLFEGEVRGRKKWDESVGGTDEQTQVLCYDGGRGQVAQFDHRTKTGRRRTAVVLTEQLENCC